MARASSTYQAGDYEDDPHGEDWQDLRGELVALLGEVEAQVERVRPRQSASGISERMRALREQVAGHSPDARHREALRSVKRAVDRFSERDETGGENPRGARHPLHEREMLETAIREIRANQRGVSMRRRAAAPRPDHDDLAQAIDGLAGRLERLEAELRTSARSQTGNVKEIAEQIAQLSHVVELLAGAVGETGQVKRLEAQIAGLANLVSRSPQVDLLAVTQRLDELAASIGTLSDRQSGQRVNERLDDVAATVGRLADLQVQFANRVDASAAATTALGEGVASANASFGEGIQSIDARIRQGNDAVQERVSDGMRTIEEGVRNIYDRLDAIEKSTAIPQGEIERLTVELARFTAAMENPPQPSSLVALAEDLNARIAEIESGHSDVGGLKADAEALRVTVREAVEPRFAAIEMQIEALAERMGDRRADIGVEQLETQVRQLVARMDQTGEQLTGLTRLYSDPPQRHSAPDYEALADLVAARTSEAVAQNASQAAGIADAGIDEIERRLSRLMSAGAAERPTDDFVGIEASIREVNERLARLEANLTRRAAPDESGAEVIEPAIPGQRRDETTSSEGDDATATDVAPMPPAAENAPEPAEHDDAMPARPAEDAPLTATPFGDPDPVLAALDARNDLRRQHPGLGEPEPSKRDRPEDDFRSKFDPAAVERPPAPISSLAAEATGPFDAAPPAPVADSTTRPDAPEADAPEPAAAEPPSTNTFIAAARRAAQRTPKGRSLPGDGSLVARAFDRSHPSADKEQAPARAGKSWSWLRGRKKQDSASEPERGAATPRGQPDATARRGGAAGSPGEPGSGAREAGLLSRYRRPILLALAVAAIGILTINLVLQRQGSVSQSTPTSPDAATSDTTPFGETAPELEQAPLASVAPQVTPPRIIPMVDTLATSSIATATGFSDTPATPHLAFAPSGTTPQTLTVSLPADAIVPDPAGPTLFEPPPEALGPDAMRLAAANGDARAQFEVAAIYTEGRAVPEDLETAAVWYERSAAQGFAPAQYRLGNLYETGRGVTKDLEQARLWYQRAAEAGNRMAMHNLAALYAGGEMGKQHFDTAAEWFQKAAERGMRDSQFNLGMLYARGLGVPQSLEDSYKWFAIAAQKGDTDAARARDDILRSLDAETVKLFNEAASGFRPVPIDLAANYAPIGTWSETFDPGEAIARQEIVQAVQAALVALGFEVGEPDGLAGPKTSEAIRAFERATGMSETGVVNPRLLAVLGSQPV